MSTEPADGRLLLHVVTPCARVANLPAVAESIRRATIPPSVDIRWWVVVDDRFAIDLEEVRASTRDIPGTIVERCHATGVAGHAQRNHVLERTDSGWVVFVDDDNLFHPDLPARLAAAARPSVGAIVYDQDLGEGSCRVAAAKNVRVGKVDSAQFAVERTFVGDLRFRVYAYCADSIFLESLYRSAPGRFVFLNEVLSTYNAQTPGAFAQLPPGRRELGPMPAIHTGASLFFHRRQLMRNGIEIDPETVGLRCNLEGDRLFFTAKVGPGVSAASGLSVLLPSARYRLTGTAWLIAAEAQLRIGVRKPDGRDERLINVSLSPRFGARSGLAARLERSAAGGRLLKRNVGLEASFEAVPGSSFEIAVIFEPMHFEASATATIESLTLTPIGKAA